MTKPHDMADREIEKLLSGWRPGADDSQGLARFFKDLDKACPLPSTDHCEAAHVNAMIEASRLSNSADSLASRPVGNTTRPKPQAQGSPQTGRITVRLPLLHKVVSMPIRIVIMIAAFMVVGGGVALAAGITDGFTQAPGRDDNTAVTVPGDGVGQPNTTDVTTDDTTVGSDETDCTDTDCADTDCTVSNCPCVDCDNYSGDLGPSSDDCTAADCPCVECDDDAATDEDAVDQSDESDVDDTDDTEVDDSETDGAGPDTGSADRHDLGTTSDTELED
jgi:hypothetical protein